MTKTIHQTAFLAVSCAACDKQSQPSPINGPNRQIVIAARYAALSVVTLAMLVCSASAHDFSIGDINIDHPWTRATPGGARVASGYITIENFGSKPDRLIGGAFEASERVELHEMTVSDGLMRMRALSTGIELPAGRRIEVKPGGYHIMFLELRRPLKQGEKISGSLVFERAGTVAVEFQVDAMGSPGVEAGHPH
ncbi:copper chaperone PCu(A)C [Rhabdaerophilum sp. SD176]|uniref:copper chaperone PCu(A)C n=1 Tax=Rhabdaerophilum sp. SD176 TaxID=2983548 RepID=UPI0024DF8D53|nr:copper chaperone PCu(A)C [Rhabdaerophilum sp. SD176]